jgi:ABC-type nitrate/sulfonate/bicarbonate transport system substrate-binding protein
VERYAGAAVFAKSDWLRGHPEAARKLCRALGEARQWAVQNGTDAVLAKIPALSGSGDPVLYREVVKSAIEMLHPNGRMDAAVASAASRTVSGSRTPKDTYTNEYIP